MEVSCNKRPPAKSLPRHWRSNYHSMLALLEAADGGVSGLVLDTEGRPVAGAEVRVEGIDKVTTSTDRGEFWRLLLPGFYKYVQDFFVNFKIAFQISFRISAKKNNMIGSVSTYVSHHLGDGSVRADIILDNIEYQNFNISTQRNSG